MRILITGITGFVGGHLARHLLAQRGNEVHGLARDSSWTGPAHDLAGRVTVEIADLCDSQRVTAVLQRVQPERLYHLAGYADTAASFREPEAAWRGNLEATRSLYDAVVACGGRTRILFVSSGAIYGEPADPAQPIDEQTELRPNNPYAASKAAADLLSYQMHRTHRLEIVRVRPFNHVGPGQSPAYAVANFARQLAAIERNESPPVLRVGNLAAERDLTDVRDVVRAYALLLERGTPGEAYNLASGRLRPMREYLEMLLSFSRVRVRVETDPALMRKVDTSTAPVDVTKLRNTTGWSPEVALEQTLRDTLEYWREPLRVAKDA